MPAPAYLWVFVTWSIAVIAFVVLTGLAVALNIFGYPSREEMRTFKRGAALFVAWLGVCVALALADSLPRPLGLPGVRLALSALIAAAAVFVLLGTRTGAAIIASVPQSWLVGVQAYRGLGSMFLLLTGAGLAPAVFGLPAGFGDVAIGLVAIPLAAIYASRPWSTWPAVAAWNVLGLADLVMAVSIGVLTAPGVELLPGGANYALTQWPMNMIAVFAVPLSVVLHVVSLTKLARDRRTVRRRAEALEPRPAA